MKQLHKYISLLCRRWLVGRLAGWLAGWLVGSLVGWWYVGVLIR